MSTFRQQLADKHGSHFEPPKSLRERESVAAGA